MNAQQIVLPFRLRCAGVRTDSSPNLIGRSYAQDEVVKITVTGISTENPGRVVVERNIDGKTWSMPRWLVRLILLQESNRAA